MQKAIAITQFGFSTEGNVMVRAQPGANVAASVNRSAPCRGTWPGIQSGLGPCCHSRSGHLLSAHAGLERWIGRRTMCRAGAGATTALARWATIMVLVALATVSSDALASLTFYTNKATFQAAAPGLVTEDFEAAHLGPDGYTVCTDPFAYV